MDANVEHKIQSVVAEIKQLHPMLQQLASRLREKISNFERTRSVEELRKEAGYWILVAYVDALIRLRLLIEQNFNFIETIGLLAVTRYVFEVLVWLKVLRRDQRYGLVYRFQVIEKQLAYYRDYYGKVEKEIKFLRQLGQEEDDHFQTAITKIMDRDDATLQKEAAVAQAKELIESETDRKARRHFCLYAEQAKTNGYGYQAYLVEKQVLPPIDTQVQQLERERSAFLSSVTESPPVGSDWEHQNHAWQWKAQAKLVDMLDQYEFIYTFASRLVHATPVSMTTDQKLLEAHEVHVFVEYVFVAILDAIDLGRGLLELQ
jgi:hypothetical protein